jgi:hypothetical protein
LPAGEKVDDPAPWAALSSEEEKKIAKQKGKGKK